MNNRIFYVILVAIVIATPVLLVTIYYGFQKLTNSYEYCKSFGQIDDELGWRLKENTTSCLSLKNYITGEVYFDTKIYTDNYGFRSAGNKDEQKYLSNSILAIGDSWTFGYGVDFEEAYPYQLSLLLGKDVVNSGVPAYGSGSTYLLAKKNISEIRPNTVIYLTKGLWHRSVCTKPWSNKKNIEKQLIPCYIVDDRYTFEGKFEIPKEGVIKASVDSGVYPGGSLTAGYDSFWHYIFYVKPKLVWRHISDILGLSTKQNQVTPLEGHVIRDLELSSYLELMQQYDFKFVLVDPYGSYYNNVRIQQHKIPDDFIYLGKDFWKENFIPNFNKLEPNQQHIPKDGHYTVEANKLLAETIFKGMRQPIK